MRLENERLTYQLNERQFKIASEQIVADLIEETISQSTQEIAMQTMMGYKNHMVITKEVTHKVSENMIDEQVQVLIHELAL